MIKKFISVSKQDVDFICRAFNITDRMVRYALTYTSNTELAQRIRKLALSRGCKPMVEIPEMETWHDADGIMTHWLPNGALVKVSKHSGYGWIEFKGKKVKGYENVKCDALEAIQAEAAALR
ncbi:MAG: hypothetical protein SO013_09515 [Prevotella sp.]|nr:hypothetical protein [Prevotella sp.]